MEANDNNAAISYWLQQGTAWETRLPEATSLDVLNLLNLAAHGNETLNELLYWELKKLPYNVFQHTRYWYAICQIVKKRAGMRCQVCNRWGNLQVHHRDYAIRNKEHLHLIDLTALCKGCHNHFHFGCGEQQAVYERPEKPEAALPSFNLKKDEILLDDDKIQALYTNGSLTTATIVGLGADPKKVKKGWFSALWYKPIKKETYERALAGVGVYAGKRGKLQQQG